MSKTPRMPHIYRDPRQGRMATLVAAIADPAPLMLDIINARKRMPYFYITNETSDQAGYDNDRPGDLSEANDLAGFSQASRGRDMHNCSIHPLSCLASNVSEEEPFLGKC